MRPLFIWLAGLITTATAVVVLYERFDRPVALFIHEHLRHPNNHAFEQLTHIPDSFDPIAVIAFFGLGLWALAGRALSTWQANAFLCSASFVFSEAAKNQLKFIFGRTWPETWVQNNPSFIKDGTYGFNFMSAGSAYQSFPSGHTAAICAVMSVVWIQYPKLRALCSFAVILVVTGLIGANYHFISDVVAGGFIGISAGWLITTIWRSRKSET
jgi:membrane-associated phospholipid phosphatase